MRLFVAIDVEDKDFFTSLQKRLVHQGVRSTFPKEFHLTLKFLGDLEDEKEIIKRLQDVSFKEFDINVSGIKIAPSRTRIHTIWVDLEEEEVLMDLQRQIDISLKNIREEKREFHPHITLARVKNIQDEDKVSFVDMVEKIEVKPFTAKVSSFKLIASELSKQGPVYKDMAVFTKRS